MNGAKHLIEQRQKLATTINEIIEQLGRKDVMYSAEWSWASNTRKWSRAVMIKPKGGTLHKTEFLSFTESDIEGFVLDQRVSDDIRKQIREEVNRFLKKYGY